MPGAIYAEGLVKTFGDVRALDGVDLDVPEGTVLGLLGPNGAGKTTAVRCPDHPAPARQRQGRRRGHRRAQAPQRGAALDRPVRPVRRGRRIPDRPREPPDGRPALPDEGEGRRRPARTSCWSSSTSPTPPTAPPRRTPAVCAAGSTSRRRSSSRPPVMFMDEPTTGLDPRNRQQLWEVIQELVSGGTTLLLTTQYLEEADHLAHDICRGRPRQASSPAAPPTSSRPAPAASASRSSCTSASTSRPRREVLRGFGKGETTVEQHTRKLTVPVTGGAKLLAEVIRELDTRGIEIDDIGLRRPTLDDVFLSLTGHARRGGGRGERHGRGRRPQGQAKRQEGGRQVSAVTDAVRTAGARARLARPVRPRLPGRRQAQPDPDDPDPRDGDLRADPADHVRGAVHVRLRRLDEHRRHHRPRTSTASS